MNSYCFSYKAPIYKISQPNRPRGHIWGFRENTNLKYSMDSVIEDFEKKHRDMIVGEVVATFHKVCPIDPTDDIFIELHDADDEPYPSSETQQNVAIEERNDPDASTE
jgi:hypothetical protein